MIVKTTWTTEENQIIEKLKNFKTVKSACNYAVKKGLNPEERFNVSYMIIFKTGHKILIKKGYKCVEIVKYDTCIITPEEQINALYNVPICYGYKGKF